MEKREYINLIDSWRSIDESASSGLYKKRINIECPITIYAIAESNEGRHGIGFSLPKTVKINFDRFKKLSEITLKLIEDASFPGNNIFLILLEDRSFSSIFNVFCSDIIDSIKTCQNAGIASSAITKRIAYWLKLFNKKNGNLLNLSEQYGLFGELWVLKELMVGVSKDHYFNIVSSWTGPECKPQDFQSPKWALEVKTSTGSTDDFVMINGKQQLDYGVSCLLFLIHVALRKGNGITLPELIGEIRKIIGDDLNTSSIFNAKLDIAGYKDSDSADYNICYSLRYLRCYKVEDDFPRITEASLADGILEVSYTLSISACSKYEIDFKTLKSAIEL